MTIIIVIIYKKMKPSREIINNPVILANPNSLPSSGLFADQFTDQMIKNVDNLTKSIMDSFSLETLTNNINTIANTKISNINMNDYVDFVKGRLIKPSWWPNFLSWPPTPTF
jgi:hypothetical protein